MNYNITYSSRFYKELKRLAKKYHSIKQDYADLLESLETNPTQGADLGNGIRKVRMAIASKGKGKSGGARVITYTMLIATTETEIKLLTIYDKSEKANITDTEIQELRKANGID